MSHLSELTRQLGEELDPRIRSLLAKIVAELEEQRQQLEATATRQAFIELAEAQRKTNEHLAVLTQTVHELAQAQKKTEERLDQLTQRVDQLTERLDQLTQRVDEGFRRVYESIAALGSRWGIHHEEVFRRTIEALLAKQELRVERGYYGNREVDVVVRNGEHLLLEITSQLRMSDIDKLLASAEEYEQREGVRPQLMIASSYVPPKVMRRLLASAYPIELISYEEVEGN